MTDTLIDDISLFDSYHFKTYRIIKPLSPKQKQTIIDIEKMSGVIQASKKFEGNLLIARGEIEADNLDELTINIQDLAGFLYSDLDRQIKFSDQADRYWLGQYLDNPDILRNYNFSPIELIFTCNDPFAYAITPDTDDRNITINGDNFIISNTGHYYAFPVITITFNQAQTHIYIQNDGIDNNRIDISKSFKTDDELEIDCKNRTIKLNGTSSMAGFGDGGLNLANWIMFATGDNSVTVGTDDADIDIDMNTTFNKVYFY